MPSIDELRIHMQRLSAVTAIFSVEMGEPRFIFNPRWRKRQQVAMNINGCGDELYIHFLERGCFVKGFAHESEMTPYKRSDHSIWPGVLDSVPTAFDCSLREPAFDPAATTFAIWRLASDSNWCTGKVNFPPNDYKDGSADLLAPLTFTASGFTQWLAENYETDVDADIIQSVFDGQPLSVSQMSKLNPSSPLHAIRDAVRATGYHIQDGG
ncbi:MAG: hypothetical protein WBD20_28420 [Pirellulaceae bacterium]